MSENAVINFLKLKIENLKMYEDLYDLINKIKKI